MPDTYIMTGTLTDAQSVTLDEALPLSPTRVRLIVEPLSPTAQCSYQEVMAEIRQRQQVRGYQPPTREEIDTSLRAERDSWEQ